jgi:hypothetical protein
MMQVVSMTEVDVTRSSQGRQPKSETRNEYTCVAKFVHGHEDDCTARTEPRTSANKRCIFCCFERLHLVCMLVS